MLGRLGWPQRGVYFFFEDGELRSDTGQGPRVVRVGTHALIADANTKLWGRLRQHRGTLSPPGGNHRGSIFRGLVGTAIAVRRPEHAAASWSQRRIARELRDGERELEKLVSQTIAAMPFLWLAIDDDPGPCSQRAYIERNSIALLSNYDRPALDGPSSAWLGNDCNRPYVRASGLWNQVHVDATHDTRFLDVLATAIEEVPRS